VWEGFQAIVGAAPEDARKYGTFHSWVNGNYIRSQGLAVRRQVDVDDDVVSLGRLLDRIAKSPSVLSRERYLAGLHRTTPDLGNEFFDALVGLGAKALDAASSTPSAIRLSRARWRGFTLLVDIRTPPRHRGVAPSNPNRVGQRRFALGRALSLVLGD
jgi:hypothetical protein